MRQLLATRSVSITELKRSPSAVLEQAGAEPGSKSATKSRGFSPKSRQDLLDVGDYVAKDSRGRA